MIELLKNIATYPLWALIGMGIGLFIFFLFLIMGFNVAQKTKAILHDSDYSIQPSALYQYPLTIPANAKIFLNNPQNGAIVDRECIINGATISLPVSYERWILIYSSGLKAWYPSEILTENEEFSISVTIGAEKDHNRQFKIILFITNEIGGSFIRSSRGALTALPAGNAYGIVVNRR